jgi:hypothetical protein
MADLLRANYSPRLVRFWLSHWEELTTLEEGGRGCQGLLGELSNEWTRLQAGQGRPDERRRACLCSSQAVGSGTEAEATEATPGGGGQGDAAERARRLVADLELAADAQPCFWEATRRVYEAQGREGAYLFRREAARRMAARRPQDAWPEAAASDDRCMLLMAWALGWRPPAEPPPEMPVRQPALVSARAGPGDR